MPSSFLRRFHPRVFMLVLTLLLLVVALLALSSGAVQVSWTTLFAQDDAEAAVQRSILLNIRLPRMLLALLAGAALAQAGVALQALFRNPLADSGLLGVTGGAALFAAAWLLFAPLLGGLGSIVALGLPLSAALGALLAVIIVLKLALRHGQTDMPSLLLAGVAVNAFCAAGLALLQTLASDRTLRDLTQWLYGNLGRADWQELAIGLPLLLAANLLLPREAARLDALLLGEPAAQHLGVDVEQLKRRLLLWVIVSAAVSVALAGMIGFIGLIVPHLMRGLLGPGHRRLMPAAALAGAGLLCAADTAARSLFAPLEIPVGVLTALLGVPVFVLLIARARSALAP